MKMGFKYATHVWLYHLLMLFVGLLFIGGLANVALSVTLNVLLLAAVLAMALNEGAYCGEKACTLAVSLEKQLKEGRRMADSMKHMVFSRKVAAWILIFGAAPFLLVSTVNAIVAPFYPEFVVEKTTQEELDAAQGDFAFNYEDNEEELAPVNVVNVAARLVFTPYVSTYTLVRGNVLNVLFFLYSLPLPVAFAVGYLLGPKMRERKLKDIARGKKRKMRNLKVNRKPREQKAEV